VSVEFDIEAALVVVESAGWRIKLPTDQSLKPERYAQQPAAHDCSTTGGQYADEHEATVEVSTISGKLALALPAADGLPKSTLGAVGGEGPEPLPTPTAFPGNHRTPWSRTCHDLARLHNINRRQATVRQ